MDVPVGICVKVFPDGDFLQEVPVRTSFGELLIWRLNIATQAHTCSGPSSEYALIVRGSRQLVRVRLTVGKVADAFSGWAFRPAVERCSLQTRWKSRSLESISASWKTSNA